MAMNLTEVPEINLKHFLYGVQWYFGTTIYLGSNHLHSPRFHSSAHQNFTAQPISAQSLEKKNWMSLAELRINRLSKIKKIYRKKNLF